MTKCFIDTNVVVYANDARDEAKQHKAIELITDLMRQRRGVVSTQVLQEYAATALAKLMQAPDVVERQLLLLESLEVVTVSPAVLRRAVSLRAVHGISFWDACILSAAESAGCAVLYSENFAGGRFYSGLRVVNPFDE